MGGKKSSCILLLAALAAFLRLGRTEDDPLPQSLVEMFEDRPIDSIDDLKRLLDTDFVDEEEESEEQTTNGVHSSHKHHRLPRSLIANAEPAQQAACKVRTEVLEVTRSMHDRTNAHFMLWPLCVEVQRCSGCCSSRSMQCVPIAKDTRQLQMTKITYMNGQAHFDKVIIPVEDHVRCGCQPLSSLHSPPSFSSSSSSSSFRMAHSQPSAPPPPPRLPHKPPPPPPPSPPRSHSKESLHRHDILKHNQQEDSRLDNDRVWPNKYSPSHTAPEPHHTPARLHPQTHTVTQTDDPHAPHRHPHTLAHTHALAHSEDEQGRGQMEVVSGGAHQSFSDGSRQEEVIRQPLNPGSGDDNNKYGTAEGRLRHLQPPQDHHHQPPQFHSRHPQFQPQPPQLGSSMLRDSAGPQQSDSDLAYTPSQSDPPIHHPSKLDTPTQRHSQGDMVVYSGGSSSPSQQDGSSLYSGQPEDTRKGEEEEERRRKYTQDSEDRSQIPANSQPHGHHLPSQSQYQTSSQNTETEVMTTLLPLRDSWHTSTTPRPPLPPPLRRRRPRKHRRRISKASMRAMIMVMS